MSIKKATLALIAVILAPQRWTGRFLDAHSRVVLNAALAASLTYILLKMFQASRHHQLKLEPFRAKSTLKRVLMGHTAEVGENGTWRCYKNWAGQSVNNAKVDTGKPGYVEFFGGARMFVTHPLDFDYVLNPSQPGRFRKGRGYELLRRFLGSGLLTTVDDKIHSAHRRVLGPAFSPKSLKHLANTVVPQHTLEAIDKLNLMVANHEKKVGYRSGDPGMVEDLQSWLDNLAFGIIAQVAFKTEKAQEEEGTRVRKLFNDGFINAFSVPRMSPVIEKMQVGKNKVVAKCRSEIMDMVSGIVKTVRAENSESSVTEERADALIDYLVHSKAFTEQEISDHSMVFLFAGFDTTSSALGWAIYTLGRYPQVQARLFEEVSSCIGLGQSTTLDSLRDCKYLAAVCKETLRLFPPAHMIVRNAVTDDVLPGSKTFVPGGTAVMCSTTVLHRNKKYWGEDADDFKPERWEEPGFDEKVNGFCFMPFSVGKRNCIGKDFAMNEFLLILAMVARNFELGIPKGQVDPTPDARVVLRPAEPIKLVVNKRKS